MKCVIDEFGMLIIDGIEKKCPYSSKRCGTWCALFNINKDIDKNHVYVELCKKTWDFWVEDFKETEQLIEGVNSGSNNKQIQMY